MMSEKLTEINKRTDNRNQGYTLIEVLIASTITGFAMRSSRADGDVWADLRRRRSVPRRVAAAGLACRGGRPRDRQRSRASRR